VLHRLSCVCNFVDDLFVSDFLDFENFMYLDQDFFDVGIHPKTSVEFNCISEVFSCYFLDVAMKQTPQLVYHVIYLTNIFNQSMQVLKCLACVMSIPIFQLLLSRQL
jgi:hypothetical protein